MAKTIVLISGGNRGIGLETVKALLESAPSGNGDSNGDGAPYHIYLGSRDLEKGQAVAAGLQQQQQHGNTVSAIQLDITSPESVEAAVARVAAEWGRLDVLINNAGVNMESIADEAVKMNTLYDINVVGASRMTDAFKPLLLAARPETADGTTKTRRIVHVTSSMGSTTSRLDPAFEFYHARHNAYRCTKAALGMLAACHAYDLRDAGVRVRVHAFDPGWAATEFGGGDPAVTRGRGAVDPGVSGRACRDVVEGKRDHQSGVMVSIHENTYPW